LYLCITGDEQSRFVREGDQFEYRKENKISSEISQDISSIFSALPEKLKDSI